MTDAVVIHEDTRTKRNRVIWGEAHYREAARGLAIEIRREFKIPSEEVREIMRRTVKAYLDGSIEPFGGREVGHRDAQRKMHRYMIRTDNPKRKGALCWRAAECPMEMKYLSSIFFHSRDDECDAADWESGDSVKPWLTMSASDGSAVRLLAIMEEGESPSNAVETIEEQEEEEDDVDETPKQRKARRKRERNKG